MKHRISIFMIVGSAGFVLQIATVAMLTAIAHWSTVAATIVGVEAAVLNNFIWHERWTWADRLVDRETRLGRLARFHLTTGLTSIVGNVAISELAVRALGINAVAANVVAVAAMSVANFVVADRWVFVPTVATVAIGLFVPSAASATELSPRTAAAWNQYTVLAEQAFAAEPFDGTPAREPAGEEIAVPGGTIHKWRGSVFVAGVTLDRLVSALMNPGTPPPQADILESRVLARSANGLRVYLKLERTAIVSVRYDTEHEVTFARRDPTLATSRSVATKIAEIGGGDRGFLWRLNSCWRYRAVPGGVEVEVLSLSLSRGIPGPVKAVVSPIVRRIARDSMLRTLDAMKRFGEAQRPHGSASTLQH